MASITLLEWREDYFLGIDAVDREHRELVECINTLYNEWLRAGDASGTGHFLSELHALTSAHFSQEEAMMRSQRYDEYEGHRRDHKRLLDSIRFRMDDYADGTWVDIEAFSRELSDWFADHFRSHDARLYNEAGAAARQHP